MDQQIDVGHRAEQRLGVDGEAEGDPLQREERHAAGGERVGRGGERPFEPRAVHRRVEHVAAQPLPRRAEDRVEPSASVEGPRQQRRRPVGPRLVHDFEDAGVGGRDHAVGVRIARMECGEQARQR